jgi:outer membrane protein
MMSQQLKTALMTAAFAVSSLLPRVALAQDAKIALVDMQSLVRTSDEGKDINAKIEKRFQTISGEMEKLRKEIEDKESNLRQLERTLNSAAKAQRAKEIDEEKIRFDRKNQDYQKEISEMEATLLGPVAERAQQELSAFVNEKGYTILIDLSAEKANVVWANSKNDITPDVQKRMNDTYKKLGGSVPAKPAAAPPADGAKPAPTPGAAPAAPTTPSPK